ncbi:MAG: DUF4867 family protein [Clostridia bacterium]
MKNNIKISNPNIKLYNLSDNPISRLYHKLNYDTSSFVTANKALEIGENNCYIAEDSQFSATAICKTIEREVFAEATIQIGWCYGKGNCLNGMEWHKSSEVIVACTDLVLFLGDYFDIENDIYATDKAIALYLKKGEIVELSPLTLHLAPINIDNDFRAIIILPKGTNSPLLGGISGTLRAKNKWLLCHKDNINGIKNGGKIGVVGDNLTIIREI